MGVSPSGYYAWLEREAPERYYEDQQLLKLITRIYWDSEGRYGSPRVHKALQKQGVHVGRKRVERLMREAGLRGRVVRVTMKKPGWKRPKVPGTNLLLAMDKPTSINQVWVGDVTYIKVNGQWQYLSTVMDQYSRRIIGWSLSSARTAELTKAAMRHAMRKRGYPKGVVFHTDRGIEYMAGEYQQELKRYEVKHSVNRPRYCTDNAFMESFYHSLKTELIRGNVYESPTDLHKAIGGYINGFYNSVRLHSGIDYCSPIEYEAQVAK